MSAHLNYLWRLSVTGLSFLLFGLGGIVMTLLVFAPLRWLPGGESVCQRRSQALIRRSFAALLGFLRRLGVMRLELRNTERLRDCGNLLVFANHPSYLDVVVMLSLMPRSFCVVSSRLWRNPFYGGVVRSAGYIRNDDPVKLVDDCVAALDRGEPLVIFPEGTRSIPGQPLRMQRGAAHVALRSGRDILPVLLRCDPPTLTKGMPWWRIPSQPFCITLDVRPPLKAAPGVGAAEPPGVAARSLTAFLEHYFTTELQRHA